MSDSTITEDFTALATRAKALVIRNAEDYERVAEFLRGVKQLREQVAATLDGHIHRAYEAHRLLVKEKRDAEAAAVEAERIAKDLLVAWDTQQQQRDAEERARLELARQASVAVIGEAIADAEANGNWRHADELRAGLVMMPPVALPPSTPKVDGISFRETWSAKVVDLSALVKAAAAHAPWVALLKPDMSALNTQARSLRGRLRIPGVEAVCSKDVAARRAPTPRSIVGD